MGFLSIDSLYFSVHQTKPALTLTIAVVARSSRDRKVSIGARTVTPKS